MSEDDSYDNGKDRLEPQDPKKIRSDDKSSRRTALGGFKVPEEFLEKPDPNTDGESTDDESDIQVEEDQTQITEAPDFSNYHGNVPDEVSEKDDTQGLEHVVNKEEQRTEEERTTLVQMPVAKFDEEGRLIDKGHESYGTQAPEDTGSEIADSEKTKVTQTSRGFLPEKTGEFEIVGSSSDSYNKPDHKEPDGDSEVKKSTMDYASKDSGEETTEDVGDVDDGSPFQEDTGADLLAQMRAATEKAEEVSKGVREYKSYAGSIEGVGGYPQPSKIRKDDQEDDEELTLERPSREKFPSAIGEEVDGEPTRIADMNYPGRVGEETFAEQQGSGVSDFSQTEEGFGGVTAVRKAYPELDEEKARREIGTAKTEQRDVVEETPASEDLQQHDPNEKILEETGIPEQTIPEKRFKVYRAEKKPTSLQTPQAEMREERAEKKPTPPPIPRDLVQKQTEDYSQEEITQVKEQEPTPEHERSVPGVPTESQRAIQALSHIDRGEDDPFFEESGMKAVRKQSKGYDEETGLDMEPEEGTPLPKPTPLFVDREDGREDTLKQVKLLADQIRERESTDPKIKTEEKDAGYQEQDQRYRPEVKRSRARTKQEPRARQAEEISVEKDLERIVSSHRKAGIHKVADQQSYTQDRKDEEKKPGWLKRNWLKATAAGLGIVFLGLASYVGIKSCQEKPDKKPKDKMAARGPDVSIDAGTKGKDAEITVAEKDAEVRSEKDAEVKVASRAVKEKDASLEKKVASSREARTPSRKPSTDTRKGIATHDPSQASGSGKEKGVSGYFKSEFQKNIYKEMQKLTKKNNPTCQDAINVLVEQSREELEKELKPHIDKVYHYKSPRIRKKILNWRVEKRLYRHFYHSLSKRIGLNADRLVGLSGRNRNNPFKQILREYAALTREQVSAYHSKNKKKWTRTGERNKSKGQEFAMEDTEIPERKSRDPETVCIAPNNKERSHQDDDDENNGAPNNLAYQSSPATAPIRRENEKEAEQEELDITVLEPVTQEEYEHKQFIEKAEKELEESSKRFDAQADALELIIKEKKERTEQVQETRYAENSYKEAKAEQGRTFGEEKKELDFMLEHINAEQEGHSSYEQGTDEDYYEEFTPDAAYKINSLKRKIADVKKEVKEHQKGLSRLKQIYKEEDLKLAELKEKAEESLNQSYARQGVDPEDAYEKIEITVYDGKDFEDAYEELEILDPVEKAADQLNEEELNFLCESYFESVQRAGVPETEKRMDARFLAVASDFYVQYEKRITPEEAREAVLGEADQKAA